MTESFMNALLCNFFISHGISVERVVQEISIAIVQLGSDDFCYKVECGKKVADEFC